MATQVKRKTSKVSARQKKSNIRRVAEGKKPIVDGKKVSARSIGLTKKKAKEKMSTKSKRKRDKKKG